jgi:hypothetical protein
MSECVHNWVFYGSLYDADWKMLCSMCGNVKHQASEPQAHMMSAPAVVETVGGIGGGPARDVAVRQHVSDAADRRVRDGKDRHAGEIWYRAHGLMLVTVEEYDALTIAMSNAEFQRDQLTAQVQYTDPIIEAKDALIAELQAKLDAQHDAMMKALKIEHFSIACGTGLTFNTGALLLNLPEQRVQFGRGE